MTDRVARDGRGRRVCMAVGLLTLALLATPVTAEELELRGGKKVRGFVRPVGRELHVNVYGCSVPEMTRGVRRLRAIDVETRRPYPLADHLQAQLLELGPRDVPRRLQLMREAQSGRDKRWSKRLAQEVLVRQPDNAEALKAAGGAKTWAAERRGDPRFDPTLARELRTLLQLETGRERQQAAQALEARTGYPANPDVIERMVRSLHEPRGVRPEASLTLDAKSFPGGRYVLMVPRDYDPLTPRPLLIALHGGGIRFEKGTPTRGSPADALAHFREGAEARGWFLVCPQAFEAPWPTSKNAAFLEAVLEEICTLWHIDLERIHIVGQGGGADGAWSFGNRKPDRFASVGAAAGGKPLGATTLSGKTALWLYHGEDDEIVPIAPVRKAADALLKQKADFVYCELPKEGHGLAPAARRDHIRFIGPKRRRRAKTAWPRGSFTVPSSRQAKQAFGDPAAAWGIGLDADADAATLVALLQAGGPAAEFAALRLHENHAAARDDVGSQVRALIRDETRTQAARVWAAWLSGAWQDPEAVNPLGDTLRSSKDPRMLRVAAEAVGRIGSADSSQDLRWALGNVSKRYRAVPGREVPYEAYANACRVGAQVAEALGLCVTEPEGLFAEMEELLVRNLLMDTRRVVHAPENGEDPSARRAELAEAIAGAYRRLRAEQTLFEMLALAVKGDAKATAAMRRGLRTKPR